MYKAIMIPLLAMGLCVSAAGFGGSRPEGQPLAETSKKAGAEKCDIVATAIAAGSFKTLTAALQAAGLVETLQGQGPFTVFAPTDAAFAKLPPGVLEDLLKPENKERLRSILTYHVVPGRLSSRELLREQPRSLRTVRGVNLPITLEDGKLMIDGANVINADVEASNGVIHVIDTVLIPVE